MTCTHCNVLEILLFDPLTQSTGIQRRVLNRQYSNRNKNFFDEKNTTQLNILNPCAQMIEINVLDVKYSIDSTQILKINAFDEMYSFQRPQNTFI